MSFKDPGCYFLETNSTSNRWPTDGQGAVQAAAANSINGSAKQVVITSVLAVEDLAVAALGDLVVTIVDSAGADLFTVEFNDGASAERTRYMKRKLSDVNANFGVRCDKAVRVQVDFQVEA